MVKNYELVNPKIIGSFSSVIKAENGGEAAHKFWMGLSKHFTNNLPRFVMTLQEGGNLSHYEVSENNQGKTASFDIYELNSQLTKKQATQFLKQVKSFEKRTGTMQGGSKKRYLDSSSSDSDSEDEKMYEKIKMLQYMNRNDPIVYFWYSPALYTTFKYPSVYVPTFIAPLSPYVEISSSVIL